MKLEKFYNFCRCQRNLEWFGRERERERKRGMQYEIGNLVITAHGV